MGNSHTARYSDGQSVYGEQAHWPLELRRSWPMLMRRVADGFQARHAAAAPVVAFSAAPAPRVVRRVPVPLREVLTRADLRGALASLARRHGLDEAEVAWVWSSSDAGDERTTRRIVDAKLRLHGELERIALAEIRQALQPARRRPGTGLRLAVRTRLLETVVALSPEETPGAHEWPEWAVSPNGRRVLARMLAKIPRKTSTVQGSEAENAA